MLNKIEGTVKLQILNSGDSGAVAPLPAAQMASRNLMVECLAKADDRYGCENRSRIRRGERRGEKNSESTAREREGTGPWGALWPRD